MKWGQDTGSGAEPQPRGGGGGGRWYISSAYQCLHLLLLILFSIFCYTVVSTIDLFSLPSRLASNMRVCLKVLSSIVYTYRFEETKNI